MPWLVLLLFLLPTRLIAGTFAERDFQCPVDDFKFTQLMAASGTTFDRRSDFKNEGPIASPWPIPRCPNCHYVFSERDRKPEHVEIDRPFVLGDDYKKVAPFNTSYYCLGLILENRKADKTRIADVFVRSIWELPVDDPRTDSYLTKAVQYQEELAAAPLRDESADSEERSDQLIRIYFSIEFRRRLGDFSKATEHIQKFRAIKLNEEQEFLGSLVDHQEKLIKEGSKSTFLMSAVRELEDESTPND